jgi:hypothetical protein
MYALYLVAAIVAEVVAMPAAFFLPFAAIGKTVLPWWLSWFQTPDNDLDGDGGWVFEHWQWRFKLWRPLAIYVGRVGWLLRNRAYGFKWTVLAKRVKNAPIYRGDPQVNRNNGHFGLLRVWEGDSWQWKWVAPVKRWHFAIAGWWFLVPGYLLLDPCLCLSASALFLAAIFASEGNYCWMFNFGWLLDAYIGNPQLVTRQPRALFMFSPRIAKIKA